MRMKDSWDNKPEKTERRDTLPWQVVLGVRAMSIGISFLYQLPNVLEQLTYLTN
jgi:hypothetical protein